MIPRALAAATLAASLGLPCAVPAAADDVAALFDALGLPEIVAVMSAEGTEYGAQIAGDMMAGRDSAEWDTMVRLIYDVDWMTSAALAGLRAELDGKDVGAMRAFFEAEPGRTIVSLEVSGREALLDDAVEEAARAAAEAAAGTDRMARVEAYIAANDLVETNVVGALNANYAFYTGLVDGGAFGFDLTDDQILTEVWAQEPEIRQNTAEWVTSFLYMAYQPLSDADLEAYIAFSETRAGRDLNAALFATFDTIFEDISRALGLGAAQFLAGEEL